MELVYLFLGVLAITMMIALPISYVVSKKKVNKNVADAEAKVDETNK